ncbi:hypothetical protein GCK72_001768 [Caenorhabditis remanei]|uniref:Uncharacterized protein n=1 Tax=Caenorhabditis remanei TaxID=31234 RepID=A0A6A5HRP1_CAERE|nr:hypothetical protein GCK72_001768 [Caenorhabditis remanei]KAF1769951.1 hypothetical protein GCK72_001768 [Caenorhabditis remanei]
MPSELPYRKREEKCKRREGKSQSSHDKLRRGAPRAKVMPAIVSIPSKSPSPAPSPSLSVPPVTPPVTPPVAVVPTVAVLPLGPSVNLLKDPTANSPTLPTREAKRNHKKVKEKVEKEPPKTTIRKKKTSSATTQSISVDAKTSSEHAGSQNDKKKKTSMSDSTKKKLSGESKSERSKEPSENDDKTPKKFNPELASKFFKHLQESQRARRRSEDARLEKMPESSQLNSSIRSLRGKKKKTVKTSLETDLFKPNGEPVWVVSDRPPGECEKNENGEPITNPELADALASDGLELDEKDCFQFDSLAPFERLEEVNQYENSKALVYNSTKNLVELSDDAIKRFAMRREGTGDRARPVVTPDAATPTTPESPDVTLQPKQSTELYPVKAGPVSIITFNMKNTICVLYDRHKAILSIQNFRKKMNSMYSREQATQPE